MKTHSKNKVILGLSGGVDSAVCAYLLKKQGYDVSAAYIQCWGETGCRAEQDREDALKVALHLGIPFQVLDFRKEYKDQVLTYFFEEYKAGRAPNPDILCNNVIKFGLFYDWARKQGYEYVATGHYAGIKKYEVRRKNNGEKQVQNTDEKNHTSYYILHTPRDLKKDQTYFLYQVSSKRLEHVLFPLSNYLKSEVREIAREQNLPVAEKKDSMGICFVGDINVPQFLKEQFGVMKGEVQLCDGTVVGEHDGYYLFTVGKRGSWRWIVKSQTIVPEAKQNEESKVKIRERFDLTNMPKLYVIEIRPKENVVVVGERKEAEKLAFKITHMKVRERVTQAESAEMYVRIRNTGELLPVDLVQLDQNSWQAILRKPEFGVSPGQSAVLYQKVLNDAEKTTISDYIVVGGGIIV